MPGQDVKGKNEVQLVIFKIGDEEFGVDIAQVKEIVKLLDITRIPRSPAFIEGVVNLRGQIITVMDLAKRFELPSSERNKETAHIMVVEIEGDTVGMIVDEVSEVLKLPAGDIEHTPALIKTEIYEKYLKGVGKLKNRLLILIDLQAVLSSEEIEHVKKLQKEENK